MNINKLQKHDWLITAIIGILLTISCLMIFSTTYNTEIEIEGAGTLPKQIVFIIVGLIIYFSIIYFDIKWLKEKKVLFLIYIITFSFLIYLIISSHLQEITASTQRWIQFSFINIQPSEYAKITLILTTSYIFGVNVEKVESTMIRWGKSFHHKRISLPFLQAIFNSDIFTVSTKYLLSIIITIPIIILVFVEPALGSSLILCFLWIMLLLISFHYQAKLIIFVFITFSLSIFIHKIVSLESFYNSIGINLIIAEFDTGILLIIFILLTMAVFFVKLKLKFLLLSLIIAIIAFPILSWGWENFIQDYQKERIEVFLHGPETDPYGAGFQINQSKIALGSGRLTGRGFLQGSQSSLKVLDFAYTDFVFASLSEQFGFIGSVFILGLYLILIVRILNISVEARDTFYTLTCVGIAIMILLNVFVNIGANIGILPVTGIPLPLISYGGNSVVVNLIGLGIVQSILVNKDSSKIAEIATKSNSPWKNLPFITN